MFRGLFLAGLAPKKVAAIKGSSTTACFSTCFWSEPLLPPVDSSNPNQVSPFSFFSGHENHYEVLGVPRSASAKEIKEAYLRLSKEVG
jgi:DnaJ-domain-containing protein 1